MAWLQEDPSGNLHVSFRFGGTKYKRSLHTGDRDEANELLHRVERTIRLVRQGDKHLPREADIPTFIISGGETAKSQEPQEPKKPALKLHALLEAYFNALPPGALEAETIQGMRIHQRHLERILGENLLVGELETVHLQEYVNKRAREKGLRGKVTTTTIKKGIITLRTVWNWGVASKMLQGRFPNKGLKFPKSKEKPPFQTWAEIGRKVGRGVSNQEEQELWDALFLTVLEIDLLMKHVKANALQPFIYPMFCFAAHTGARRAEMLRSQVHDVDFEESFITLRERKKSHDATTTRRVPMSSFLAGVLKEWMTHHPGGSHTFCQTARVTRSKTTRSAPLPITPDEAHDHFKRTLADSKWARLRGWHVLRHSFISNLAAKGVDERLIDAFAGHTSEVRKRYIHLLPNVAQAAVKSVFG